MTLQKKITILLGAALLMLSCSSSDSTHACTPTKITMMVNGQLQTFEGVGYGIDLNQDGSYTLQLTLYRSSTNPNMEQGISIKLPYKKTGTNVITAFDYNEYSVSEPFHGDMTHGTFTSKVTTNQSTCFNATFSGTFTEGAKTVAITEGQLSYEYDTSFDE